VDIALFFLLANSCDGWDGLCCRKETVVVVERPVKLDVSLQVLAMAKRELKDTIIILVMLCVFGGIYFTIAASSVVPVAIGHQSGDGGMKQSIIIIIIIIS
jgi:hypothetical protein